MLSILSGKFKGQKLEVPKAGTRPTSSLVKKALFDSIRPYIDDITLCDLFAGSGAIGLEALSQGAKKVFFVEASKNAFTSLKQNISKLKCQDQCECILTKAHLFLKKEISALSSIDLFYIDPPYEIEPGDPSSYENILNTLDKADLKKDVLLILESKDKKRVEDPLLNLRALHLQQVKAYGDTFLFFLRKN